MGEYVPDCLVHNPAVSTSRRVWGCQQAWGIAWKPAGNCTGKLHLLNWESSVFFVPCGCLHVSPWRHKWHSPWFFVHMDVRMHWICWTELPLKLERDSELLDTRKPIGFYGIEKRAV